MGFLKKFFGKGGDGDPKPEASTASSGLNGDPIRVFDKFGRELMISRPDWLQMVKDNLKQHWQDADAMAGIIVQALQDGFDAQMEDAAKQLKRIDHDQVRGTVLLAIVYLQTTRPKQAMEVLEEHIKHHGESGVVLTNLAKAQSALGDEQKAMATLWHALELDPNQENGMGWYYAIHEEKGGEEASLEAMKRVAAIPKSWRAQLWIARAELKNGRLEQALELYGQSLAGAPRPVPGELLMQLSGDLGNAGHLLELLELTEPHFDIKVHGFEVGNNLIKASIDTGQLDKARELLDLHQAEQRPDWRDGLGYFESEITKARISLEEPVTADQLKLGMLTMQGPLWLPDDHPIRGRFPAKDDDAVHVALLGSTFESPKMGNEIKVQPSNSPGRYSRALPLLLTEHLALRSPVRATALIPWILNQPGGFMAGGTAIADAQVVEQAKASTASSPRPADYAIYTHLIIRGENYTLRLRLLRCIDGRCLGELSHEFPEGASHRVMRVVFAGLAKLLEEQAEIVVDSNKTTLEGDELEHYILRLEQALAVSCCTMEKSSAEMLSNPAEILDGMLHLCLQNPQHLPSRMLLLRTIRKLKPFQGLLVQSMKSRVESLMEEYPIESVRKELDAECKEALS